MQISAVGSYIWIERGWRKVKTVGGLGRRKVRQWEGEEEDGDSGWEGEEEGEDSGWNGEGRGGGKEGGGGMGIERKWSRGNTYKERGLV